MFKNKIKSSFKEKLNSLKVSLNNTSKRTFSIVFLIFLLFLIISLKAFFTPLYIEEKKLVNTINLKTNYEYESNSLPDDITSFEGKLFTKSQKLMKIKISSSLASNEIISGKGNYKIFLNIYAEELWEKTIPLTIRKSFNISGVENTIIDEELVIDIEKLYIDIERISTDIIGTKSNKYNISIIPQIEGVVLYENEELIINSSNEICFEFANEQIILDSEKYYDKEFRIEKYNEVKQNLNILGLKLPLIISRYVFSFILFTTLIYLIIIVILKKLYTEKYFCEEEYINKKYYNRFISISEEINFPFKAYIPLTSFKSLIRLSDEKDLLILKYENKINNCIIYYLIDGDCVFLYRINLD